MYTDIWRKCPGSQPHQPHLRGWAEGPGIQCISRVEGAVLWCFVWHPSAPTLVSFTCEGLLENYVFFHKELWTESKRSVELYPPLPIRPCYTHTHTHTHTHTLWFGRRGSRRWRWLQKDSGLGAKLQTVTDKDSDVQITDFYWTLWGKQLFVRKWKRMFVLIKLYGKSMQC